MALYPGLRRGEFSDSGGAAVDLDGGRLEVVQTLQRVDGRPEPRGYFGALAVEGDAASVRVLPWSPLHGVTRGHQARTARR